MAAFLSSKPPGRHLPVRFDRVIELLAPALGKEKSEELITSCVKSLGYAADRLNLEQAIKVLTALEEQPGIVGVSARFAKTRLATPHRAESKAQSVQRSLEPPPGEAARSLQPGAAGSLKSEELAALLAHSLGTEKSREVVSVALSRLGIPAGNLDANQARAVLDLTAKAEGIVGVTARFAMARLILRFKQE